MTDLQLTGRLIAAEDDGDLLRYRLLTYGEAGNTSRGRVTIPRGALELPPVEKLAASNYEHDYTRPAGRCVELIEDATGLTAAVRPLDTAAGRDLRVEAREGVRAGISVELDRVVIRAGRLVAGVLSGMGHVVKPAFPSSTLTAADAGDLTDAAAAAADASGEAAPGEPREQDVTVSEWTDPTTGVTTRTTTTTTRTVEVVTEDQQDPPEQQDYETAPTAGEDDHEDEEPDVPKKMTAAAGAAPHQHQRPAGEAFGLDRLTAALGSREDLRASGQLTAALAPIVQTGPFDTVTTPEYVGELWDGRPPLERYAGLVTDRGPLTSITSKGWRFSQGPQVHPYAGNLADITSTPVTVETEDITAQRLAGGNRIDRIYADLPDAGFWDSYLRHSTEDYALKRDSMIGYHIATNATSVDYAGEVPTFFNGSRGWAYLIRGARQVLRKALPQWAIVGADLWEEMALTQRDDALEFLAAQLGLDDSGSLAGFRIIGASDEPVKNIDGKTMDLTGKVIVGATGTTLKQELPGGPIRINAEVIEKGGIDYGVFGYIKLWTPTKYNVLIKAAGKSA